VTVAVAIPVALGTVALRIVLGTVTLGVAPVALGAMAPGIVLRVLVFRIVLPAIPFGVVPLGGMALRAVVLALIALAALTFRARGRTGSFGTSVPGILLGSALTGAVVAVAALLPGAGRRHRHPETAGTTDQQTARDQSADRRDSHLRPVHALPDSSGGGYGIHRG
jgi:hypothetical protein